MTDETGAAFEDVFNSLIKEGEGAVPAVETPTPVAEEAPAEPAAEPEEHPAAEPAGDDAAEEADTDAGDAGDDQKTEGEQPEPEAKKDDDVLKRFADMMLEREQKAKGEQPQQEVPQQQAPQQQPEMPFSEDEIKTLNEFEKDYPDVAEAVRIVTAKNQQLLASYIFKTVDEFLKPRLELLDAIATRTHISELAQEIPQYNDEYRDKVVEWALSDKQPKYLRSAYEHVIKNGDVDEVKDLISRYEVANGAQQPQKAASRRSAEPPTIAKQAAKSMAPVSGKRSAPSVEVEPESFDDAFAKYAKELKL